MRAALAGDHPGPDGVRWACRSMPLPTWRGCRGFAGQQSGWTIPSFGYMLGFVLAAVVVGALARRGADRTVARTAGLIVVGNLCIYAVGVPWLMASVGTGLGHALVLGVAPFRVGDAVKILLASLLLPAAWRLVRS